MKLATLAVAVAATTATVLAPPAAKADKVDQLATAICTTIEADPRPSTVGAIGVTLISKGADAEQAATIVVMSVLEYCPQHFGLIKQFSSSAETYA